MGFAHSAAALFADLRGRDQHVTTWFPVSGAYLFARCRVTLAWCCLPCRRGPLFSSSSVCVTDVGRCLPTCCGKLSSPSESAKFDASACLLGTLLVTFFVGARLLGTVCVTGVGGCLPGLSWTVVLSTSGRFRRKLSTFLLARALVLPRRSTERAAPDFEEN